MKPLKTSLFIFRRDLRLADNTALQQALQLSERVICAFVIDPVFHRDPDTRIHARSFLYQQLHALDAELQQHGGSLFTLYGVPQGILPSFMRVHGVQALFVNREYTPAGIERDQVLESLCAELAIQWHSYDDALLFPPGFVLKPGGKPYTVFTPFHKRCLQYPVASPSRFNMAGAQLLPAEDMYRLKQRQLQSLWNIADQMQSFSNPLSSLGHLTDYSERRDYPAQDWTSHLSVWLKFGVVSARQACAAIAEQLGAESPLLRQLYWRDFFTQIGYHFPHVFQGAFRAHFDGICWNDNPQLFQAWCEGRTGFPLVDAGMRELKQTGTMHNRVRMVTASFLVKDLLLDWRLGERWFAAQLMDYDAAVNNGNWQWAASTGCDAQPYFRIFNPWLQQKKFDAQCDYIHRWLPELREIPARQIHLGQGLSQVADYPEPIVDHKVQSEKAKALFAAAAKQPAQTDK